MDGKPNLVRENQLGQLCCLPALSSTLSDEGPLHTSLAGSAPQRRFSRFQSQAQRKSMSPESLLMSHVLRITLLLLGLAPVAVFGGNDAAR